MVMTTFNASSNALTLIIMVNNNASRHGKNIG